MSDLQLQPNDSTDIGEKTTEEIGDEEVQLETGYGYLPVGKSQEDCKKQAEDNGGVVWDAHAQACWNLFGKVIKIGREENDIEEGFKIVNFNFHVNGDQPATPKITDLPGPSELGSGRPGG